MVSADAYLVTFDVENMYPSIDNAAAIEACTQAVSHADRGMVEALLSFVMQNAYCQNNGRFYLQEQGTAMGTNVAPPYANIYVAKQLEEPVKAQVAYWPAIYKRFIDDGFFIWERDIVSLQHFLHMLNTHLPNIKITWKISQTNVDYMDLTVTKVIGADGRGRFVLSTYQKPHNRYLYIPYNSFHRPCVFKGFVKAELLRYAVTNTLPAGFEHMKSLFHQRLLERGYPVAALTSWFAQVTHADRVRLLDKEQPVDAAPKSDPPVLVLPNGQFEMVVSLGRVVNGVFDKHKHHPELANIFGGPEGRVIVAYTKNKSLGARFVKASH